MNERSASPDILVHYAAHLARVESDICAALEGTGGVYDGVVFHSGSDQYVPNDDRALDFTTQFRFAQFVPITGPGHLLQFRPGHRARLLSYQPSDFWHGPAPAPDTRGAGPHPYVDFIDVIEVGTFDALCEELGNVDRHAYFGGDTEFAQRLGLDFEPDTLGRALDWKRAYKTEYEIACIREANRIAARGYDAIAARYLEKPSERELFGEFLAASAVLESELPYSAIIAWDRNAATLHYPLKNPRRPELGQVLLVDAGVSFLGYASDITRTFVADDAPSAMRELHAHIDAMQQRLIGELRPGRSFGEVHELADRGVAEIIADLGIVSVSADEAFTSGLSRLFFPHGLGHFLGLQVHDVGGQQAGPMGGASPPPEDYPLLRTTRTMEPSQVVTVEPGIYFIPALLDSHREDARLNASRIAELEPLGGIRIEDDVSITDAAPRNLTREFLPNPS